MVVLERTSGDSSGRSLIARFVHLGSRHISFYCIRHLFRITPALNFYIQLHIQKEVFLDQFEIFFLVYKVHFVSETFIKDNLISLLSEAP